MSQEASQRSCQGLQKGSSLLRALRKCAGPLADRADFRDPLAELSAAVQASVHQSDFING